MNRAKADHEHNCFASHSWEVAAILKSAQAIGELLADLDSKVLGAIGQTALTDEAAAGRALAALIRNRAHESARWSLGGDVMEVVPSNAKETAAMAQDLIRQMQSGEYFGLPFGEQK